MAIQVTGYLWPLYFFIGAGIVFKILRQAATVQRVAEVAFTGRWFVVVSLTLLVSLTIVAWIKPVLLLPGFPWPGWLANTAEWLYAATAVVWRSTLMRLSLDQLKWVFLAALLVACWALARRRLTSAAMARLLFVVILISFVVVEYYFQAFGFLRKPGTSAVGLFIFTVLILWLTHRTSVAYLASESPWWPSRSRVALYGAVLMFVLLPIHARAALRDQTLTNEIFLYLFFGSLNFGLPFYLYLYATRRLRPLQLRATTALGWILLGAAVSVALIVGDKLAVAGWSWSAAWASAVAQIDALAEGRQISVTRLFPASWILVRGLLLVIAFAIIGTAVGRRVRDANAARSASVFAIIGVAAGLACFSNRGLELPLMPQPVTFFIAPLHSAMVVDASLAVRYGTVLLPALILSLSIARNDNRVRQLLTWALAAGVTAALGLIWPAREPWLRSTGTLFATGMIGLIVIAALAVRLRDELQSTIVTSAAESDQSSEAPLLTWPELRMATAVVIVVLSMVTVGRVVTERSKQFALSGSASHLRLPVSWTRANADIALNETRFERPSWSATPSTLLTKLHVQATDSSDLSLLRAATSGTEIEPIKVERWERVARGAFAVDFRVKGESDSLPGFGTAAVARLPNGDALLLTVMYSSTEFARRWDVARALQAWPRQ
jgi:hypothetical protein